MVAAISSIRVGLIGYGAAGAFFHAPLIASTPGLRLVSVVTADAGRSAAATRDHPGVRVLPRADQLWANAESHDLVVVATPNRTHVPLATSALDVGLPVVVDKPLAATAAEGRRLVGAARSRALMLTVFQNRRWDGDFLTLRRLHAEGRLGEIRRFESRFERWRPVPKPGWRQQGAPDAAGGVLYDLGSHLIDQALLLLGPVERVYAELDRHHSGSEVDDDAFVALVHRSGARSHLWMSTVAADPGPRLRALGSLAAYTRYGLDVQEAALKAGARPGAAGWGEEPPEAWGRLGAGGDLRPVRTEPGAYPEFYRGVVRCLRDGEQPPVSPADAVVGLEVIAAARRSAAAGDVVTLPTATPGEHG